MSTFDYSTACRHVALETSSTACQIKGTVPNWLDGFVLFNGPGLTKIGLNEFKHAFDSSAILQRFEIKKGEVSYMTKFLQSNTFKNNEKMNAITVSEFGTPGSIQKGAFARLKNAFDSEKMLSDNALIQVLKMGPNFFALGECPFFLQIDPVSLDVLKRINMYKNFSLATQSVHVIEEEDGYYMLGQAITMTGPKYSVIRFPKDGDVENGKVVASVSSRWKLHPCYIHSMAFTKNYMIVIEPPLAVSIMELLGGVMKNTPFIDGIHWQDETTVFHIVDRKTWKEVGTKYVSDPFFFLHFCNVYEKDDHIVVDVSAYKDATILQNLFIAKLREAAKNGCSQEFHAAFRSVFTRFVIPLDVNSAKENEELVKLPDTLCSAIKTKKEIHLKSEVLSEFALENAVTNKKFSLNGNRFVWGMGASPEGENYGYIMKFDLTTKETKMFHERDAYPSPFIFVPSPDAQDEDDGVILTLLLTSSAENLVTLLVLDAASMTELARATVEIDTASSMPIHGDFFTI